MKNKICKAAPYFFTIVLIVVLPPFLALSDATNMAKANVTLFLLCSLLLSLVVGTNSSSD